MYIRRKLSKIKWFLKILKRFSVRKNNESVVILLATPVHGNLGDHAIVHAEKKIITNRFKGKKLIEIENSCYLAYGNMIKRFVHKDDIIVIDGGGNLGTLWKHEDDKIRSIIEMFAENKIIVFPQTCYYDDVNNERERIVKNRKAYESAKDLTIMLRDRESFELFTFLFPSIKTLFVPDIVLSLHPEIEEKKRGGVFLCFREDCEKNICAEKKENIKKSIIRRFGDCEFHDFSTLVPCGVNEKTREKELKIKWEELSKAKLLVCDRLHAMIFALITETPCIALDNVSKKVSGTYEWLQDIPYIQIVNDEEEFARIIEEFDVDKKYENIYQYPYEELTI